MNETFIDRMSQIIAHTILKETAIECQGTKLMARKIICIAKVHTDKLFDVYFDPSLYNSISEWRNGIDIGAKVIAVQTAADVQTILRR